MVKDMTKGFWERWILLDFPYTFITKEEYDKANAEERMFLKIKDDDILIKISEPEEMSGLLNEAISGLHRLVGNNKFSTTEGSEEVKQRWIRKSNSFIAFCFDKIEDSPEGKISNKVLRKKYSEYCRLHKISPKSIFVIKKNLQEEYGAIEIRTLDFGASSNVWEGIKWKE